MSDNDIHWCHINYILDKRVMIITPSLLHTPYTQFELKSTRAFKT